MHNDFPSLYEKVFINRQLMPDMMVLDGMLICGNYNVLYYGDASYLADYFGRGVYQNTSRDEFVV